MKIAQTDIQLTRKCRQFIWGREQQEAFEEIKWRLNKAILHMPNHEDRFHLYSDTSKFATGSTLYQIQNEKPKINSLCQQETSRSSQKLFNNRVRVGGLAINIAVVHTCWRE